MWSSLGVHRALTTCGGVTLALAVLTLALNHRLYDAILDAKLVLKPGSEGYQFWHTSADVPIYMRFYFWNLTNPDDVMHNHARPALEQLGPYVYREEHLKVNMTWNENGTVTYKQVKTWFFEPSLSNGTLTDDVITLNVPLMAAAAMVRNMNFVMKLAFNELVAQVNTRVFVKHTVKEFLFEGYSDPLLEAAHVLKYLVNISIPFDRFGWFYARNTTDYYDGVFNMATGVRPADLGVIRLWNNTNVTSAFQPPCNVINGSAGELFPPHLARQHVRIYSTDVCRSMQVPYKREQTVQGLTGYQFEADEMLFARPDKNPANKCFCNGVCPPAGLLNETLCRFGVPAFVSFPHMLYVDPATVAQTSGQRPSASRHNFSLVIEPTTGIPLNVRARFQINMLLRPNSDVVLLDNVTTVYLPMLWFENTVDMSSVIADELRLVVRTLPALLSVVGYVLLAASCSLLLTAVLLVLARRHLPRHAHDGDEGASLPVKQ